MFGLARQSDGTRLARPATSVARWDPWGDFDRIRQEMDSLFGSFYGNWPRLAEGVVTLAPAVDLYETTDELVLNAYLPGMSREDIHVEVVGESIHLSGESKPNLPDKEATVHLSQGGFGRFDIRYTLPVEVDADRVTAIYRNGVLEVRMPKAESAKLKAIEVKVDG